MVLALHSPLRHGKYAQKASLEAHRTQTAYVNAVEFQREWQYQLLSSAGAPGAIIPAPHFCHIIQPLPSARPPNTTRGTCQSDVGGGGGGGGGSAELALRLALSCRTTHRPLRPAQRVVKPLISSVGRAAICGRIFYLPVLRCPLH